MAEQLTRGARQLTIITVAFVQINGNGVPFGRALSTNIISIELCTMRFE
jgi:hypothetical protein